MPTINPTTIAVTLTYDQKRLPILHSGEHVQVKSLRWPAVIRVIRAQFRILEAVNPAIGAKIAGRFFARPPQHKRPPREEKWACLGERFTVGGCAAWRFGAGPKVLLLHGWGGRGLQWNALIQPLLDAGCEVIVLDFPAHGESPGRETSFVQSGDALGPILDELQPSAVVAHSFGSGAMTVASRTRTIPCVFAGGPAETMAILERFCQFLAIGPKVRKRMVAATEQRLGWTLEEADVGKMAKLCKAPMLCIQDPHDEEIPFDETASIVANWQGAEHRAIADVGHYRILWKPEAIAAIMGFLYSLGVAKS
jgi:pimeloyl-ACP methyl ester carboxylesterase